MDERERKVGVAVIVWRFRVDRELQDAAMPRRDLGRRGTARHRRHEQQRDQKPAPDRADPDDAAHMRAHQLF
jgi:hypothetical protein